MKTQLLLTGNELMAGHTVDSNSATLAQMLATQGIGVYRRVTIGDDYQLLVDEIRRLAAHSQLVIINGGLGPTVDDLTAQALADATASTIELNDSALSQIEAWCQQRQYPMNEANKKQAMLPANCELLANHNGSAPGFYCDYNGCLILCTPGVPSEMRLMMTREILPLLSQRFPGQPQIETLRMATFGIGESSLQQAVVEQLPDWPAQVELGFRAGMPQLEIKLSITQAKHRPLQQQCLQQLQGLIGDYIIGPDDSSLSSSLVALLTNRDQTLALAESCTGGLIASQITAVAGASQMFEAGIVSYSNDVKQRVLGVDEQLLSTHGAVSEAVAVAMAEGALRQGQADYAIAVTGIAGPDGGSTEKPVGTVWIAWGSRIKLHSQQLCINANRQWFQQMVAAVAQDLLRRELIGLTTTPRYIKRYGVDG